jgi:hypothetical protein
MCKACAQELRNCKANFCVLAPYLGLWIGGFSGGRGPRFARPRLVGQTGRHGKATVKLDHERRRSRGRDFLRIVRDPTARR